VVPGQYDGYCAPKTTGEYDPIVEGKVTEYMGAMSAACADDPTQSGKKCFDAANKLISSATSDDTMDANKCGDVTTELAASSCCIKTMYDAFICAGTPADEMALVKSAETVCGSANSDTCPSVQMSCSGTIVPVEKTATTYEFVIPEAKKFEWEALTQAQAQAKFEDLYKVNAKVAAATEVTYDSTGKLEVKVDATDGKKTAFQTAVKAKKDSGGLGTYAVTAGEESQVAPPVIPATPAASEFNPVTAAPIAGDGGTAVQAAVATCVALAAATFAF
jgi:hypothetical protein